jgi:hypothetical protein
MSGDVQLSLTPSIEIHPNNHNPNRKLTPTPDNLKITATTDNNFCEGGVGDGGMLPDT